ncbi:uncharacterized mitochondrial protein AtMg00810-like [Nicotiana tomentosiformis]|uniref:uncharacterized mitochondrial protein AtMg00810-like n=1 Tax=Nicotiana tomentosiformis TaxID=4098 RepID=UPI00388CCF56
MRDYVVQQKSSCLYPLSNYVVYDHLTPAYRSSLAAYSAIVEPKTYVEANTNPLWVAAMKSEISALESNNTWTVVDLPPDKGDLCEEVYMQNLDGFSSQGEYQKVCKLNKSLYGLKQSPRQWNLKLIEALIDLGFVQSLYDYSLFTHRNGAYLVIVLVYLYDLLVTSNNLNLIEKARKDLQSKFKMKGLGELKYFLGIEFSRLEKGIHMCQRKYALELLSETGISGGKPALTPLEFNHKLTSIEFDKVFNKENLSDDMLLEDRSGHQRIVGRLLYLVMTRPGIAFVVQVLSQFIHAPKQSHLDAAMRVIKYIKGNPGLGLFLPSDGTQKMVAFCDLDWDACVDTRKSVTGYAVKFGDALILWKSKKQGTVSRSSAEAEFGSMATTIIEIKWLVGLFEELGVVVELQVQLYCDSKAAIQIAAHPIFHERTKHIVTL